MKPDIFVYINYKSPTDEKETLVRHAYGLEYPEPNITFALCRGSRSSPAVSTELQSTISFPTTTLFYVLI